MLGQPYLVLSEEWWGARERKDCSAGPRGGNRQLNTPSCRGVWGQFEANSN